MSIGFVNLLSKYLPKHFKVHPKEIEVFLDEDMDSHVGEKYRFLSAVLTPSSEEIYFDMSDNEDIFKPIGVVKIEDEYIRYDNKTLTELKLYNLERGFLGTEAVSHCNKILWTAYLGEELDAFSTTITITRPSNLGAIPKNGQFKILTDSGDEEIISYEGYNQWLNGLQFTNVTRGLHPTFAIKHPASSIVTEFAYPLISQVETIRYNKGEFTGTLATALTETAVEIQITQPFSAKLKNALVSSDYEITIYDVSGVIPKNGLIKINNEIVCYGKFEVNEFIPTEGVFKKLIRGTQYTTSTSHDVDSVIYFTVPQIGELIIDNEYVSYSSYNILTYKFKGVVRGIYASTPSSHSVGTTIKENKNLDFEKTGLIKIDNEYLKYWYVDEEFFYVEPRPSLSGENYYYTPTGVIQSIIQGHDTGTSLQTYYFSEANDYLIDFIYTIGQHLDIAYNKNIAKFENFSDTDEAEIEHLKYLVKTIGENLDDYENLPFFSGATLISLTSDGTTDEWMSSLPHGFTNKDRIRFNSNNGGVITGKDYWVIDSTATRFKITETEDGTIPADIITSSNIAVKQTDLTRKHRVRLFTKELVAIYREKGLLSAIKLWHKIISEPLKSYQDLWTFNYFSFYSLPFLILLLYESSRAYYPNDENFLKPQISKALYDELCIFYENKKLYNHPIPNLKLIISEWEYFKMADDDIKSSGGGSFDDEIVPSDSKNNLGIYYDPNKIHLELRNAGTPFDLPFNVEDYDVDLFKFEEELDAEKDTIPVADLNCFPLATDYGFVSDEEDNWIKDIYKDDLLDYCIATDRLLPIRTDIDILTDENSDSNNVKLELVHNILSTDTDIVINVIEGKPYFPKQHISNGTNPKIIPKGYIKIGDEIISYEDIEFFDFHDGTFLDKKFKLLNCERGIRGTTATSFKINLYEDYEYLINDKDLSEIRLSHMINCTVDPITDILSHIEHGLLTNDIVVFENGNGAGINANVYYLVLKINNNEFQLKPVIPGPAVDSNGILIISSSSPVTCYKVHFRLKLDRDPKQFGVKVGDYIYIVQNPTASPSTYYNELCQVVNVLSEYDYCSEEWEFGIDFTIINPPDLTANTYSPNTVYSCTISELDSKINSINHGFINGDMVYFLKGVGNIDPYINYYVANAHADYFEISKSVEPWDKSLTATPILNIWSCIIPHGLNDGDLVMFTSTNGGVSTGTHYLVTSATTTTFKIRSLITGEIVDLVGGANSIFYSSIELGGIKEINNSFVESGVRVISNQEGYQHRYSLIQHLWWRLENEVNGNDLELVYGMTPSQLTAYKLDSYKGLKDSVIWPTPHFKYGFELATENMDTFPPDEVVELVLKKLKEYKPKHTVTNFTITYPLDGTELAMTPLNENFETEVLMSDAYRSFNGITSLIHTDMILDTAFENWVDPTNLVSWNQTIAGASTVNREDFLQYMGLHCVRLDIVGIDKASVSQDCTLKLNGTYRIDPMYMNTGPGNAVFELWETGTGTKVFSVTSIYGPSPSWTSFGAAFEFTNTSTETAFTLKLTTDSANNESFYYDNAQFYSYMFPITAVNHELHEGETIYIENGDAVGLTFGIIYYVKYIDADNFQVSLTNGGPAVTISGVANVIITQAPEAEYRIKLQHNPLQPIDLQYDLPIVITDTPYDYGAPVNFNYIIREGTPEEMIVHYGPFVAYPLDGITRTDSYRRRKRFFSWVD